MDRGELTLMDALVDDGLQGFGDEAPGNVPCEEPLACGRRGSGVEGGNDGMTGDGGADGSVGGRGVA